MSKPLRPPLLSLLEKYRGKEGQTLYSTTVTVTGGEAEHGCVSGVARSDDGLLAVDWQLPEALGGTGGATNPEQLFAASYAACFYGSLSLLATRAGIPVANASVDVTVHFGRDPVDGMFLLAAYTQVRLPGVERALAEQLVRETERLTPYNKMARQGIENVVMLAAPEDTA